MNPAAVGRPLALGLLPAALVCAALGALPGRLWPAIWIYYGMCVIVPLACGASGETAGMGRRGSRHGWALALAGSVAAAAGILGFGALARADDMGRGGERLPSGFPKEGGTT